MKENCEDCKFKPEFESFNTLQEENTYLKGDCLADDEPIIKIDDEFYEEGAGYDGVNLIIKYCKNYIKK